MSEISHNDTEQRVIKVTTGVQHHEIPEAVSFDTDSATFNAEQLRRRLNELHAANPDDTVYVSIPRLPTMDPANRGFFFHGGRAYVDTLQEQLYFDDEPVSLPQRCYRLLSYLGGTAGVVRSAQQIYTNAWESSYYPGDATVRVHVSRVRALLEPAIIQTKPGFGYFTPR